MANNHTLKDILSMSANVAQIILAAIAIIAYFYTVIPIYQKEKLTEEVAMQENTIKQLSSEREGLIQSNGVLRSELETTQAKVLEAEQQRHELSSSIADLQKQNDLLRDEEKEILEQMADTKKQADEAQHLLKQARLNLDTIYYNVFSEAVMRCSIWTTTLRNDENVKSEKDIRVENDIFLVEKGFISPYKTITACLASESVQDIPISAQKEYRQKLSNKLEADKSLKIPTPLAVESIKKAIIIRDLAINDAKKAKNHNAEINAEAEFAHTMIGLELERNSKNRNKLSSFFE